MKSYIKTHSWAYNLLAKIYRFLGRNKVIVRGRWNQYSLNVPGLFLAHARIVIHGNNNKLIFLPNKLGEVTHFTKLNITIHGNNNIITIGSCSSGSGFSICMEDDNNRVVLGRQFTVGPNTELAVIEGTTIEFGDDCMLSANITLRTGDSHSITDLQGNRTNPSKSIKIGNHVWIGNTVLIFKGTQVADNSIVAGGTVGGGKIYPSHSIIGGNPAKVVKEGVNWDRRRLPL